MIFKPKTGFKIQVSGTDFEIESIYVRTRWSRSLDGKTVEVQGNVYLNKEKFQEDENKILSIDVFDTNTQKTIPIPPIANYGRHNVPENYDNNDLIFSQNVIIENLSNYLIPEES